MKAKDFDKKFEEGQEDIVDDLDLPSARRVNQRRFPGLGCRIVGS